MNWVEKGGLPRVLPDPWTHLCVVGTAAGEESQMHLPRGCQPPHPPTQPGKAKQAWSCPAGLCLCPPQSGLCCPSPCSGSPPLSPLKGRKFTCSRSPPLRRGRGLPVYSLLYHKCLELLLPRDRCSIKVSGTSELTPLSTDVALVLRAFSPARGTEPPTASHNKGQEGISWGPGARGRDSRALAAKPVLGPRMVVWPEPHRGNGGLERWFPDTLLAGVGIRKGGGAREQEA